MIMLVLILITALAIFVIWPLILMVTRGEHPYVANGIKRSDIKIIIAYFMAVVVFMSGLVLTVSRYGENSSNAKTAETADTTIEEENGSDNSSGVEAGDSEATVVEETEETEGEEVAVEESEEESVPAQDVIVTSNVHEVIHNVEYPNIPKADYSFDFDDGNAIRISSVERDRNNIIYSNVNLADNIKPNSVLGGNMLWLKDGQAVKLENVNLTRSTNESYTVAFWYRYISNTVIPDIYPILAIDSGDRDVKVMSHSVNPSKDVNIPLKVFSNVKAGKKFYAYNINSKLKYEEFEGEWHHIVLVADAYAYCEYEKEGDENFIVGKMYVDGQLRKTSKVLGMNFSSSSIYLGIDDNRNTVPLSGGYDDIKFWSTALDDTAIHELYQAYLQ